MLTLQTTDVRAMMTVVSRDMAMSVRVRVMLGFLNMLIERRPSIRGLIFCAVMSGVGRDRSMRERMVVYVCERGFDQLCRRRLHV